MFKNLNRFDIRKAMSWCDMPELGKRARILLKPATDANPAYYNAMLKKSGKRVRALVKSDEITAEDAALNRDDDRELYPQFVIAGWEFVEGEAGTDGVDDDGHVIFNRKHAAQLCEQLPNHLMDRLRNHASTPERFYGPGEAPPDPEELSGNSDDDSGSS